MFLAGGLRHLVAAPAHLGLVHLPQLLLCGVSWPLVLAGWTVSRTAASTDWPGLCQLIGQPFLLLSHECKVQVASQCTLTFCLLLQVVTKFCCILSKSPRVIMCPRRASCRLWASRQRSAPVNHLR